MSAPQRRSAAALAYDANADEGAPRVVAKGYGLVAEMIVRRAKEAGLYVHEAPEMVSLLMQVDLDARVPPQLYQAVAELLAWLHRLEAGGAGDSAAPGASATVSAASSAPVASVAAPSAPNPSTTTPPVATASTGAAGESSTRAGPLKTASSPGSRD